MSLARRCCWPPRRTYEASGRDMHTLLFGFLDELLFVFSTELFVPKELEITYFDTEAWRITAVGWADLRPAAAPCPQGPA